MDRFVLVHQHKFHQLHHHHQPVVPWLFLFSLVFQLLYFLFSYHLWHHHRLIGRHFVLVVLVVVEKLQQISWLNRKQILKRMTNSNFNLPSNWAVFSHNL